MNKTILWCTILCTLALPCLSQNSQRLTKADPRLQMLYQMRLGSIASKYNRTGSPGEKTVLRDSYYDGIVDRNESDPIVPAILWCECNPTLLRDMGVEVNSVIENYMTVKFPLSSLPTITALNQIKAIELARRLKTTNLDLEDIHSPTSANGLLTDISTDIIGAKLARERTGLTGEGVVVGIVDTGIDIRHDDFKTADGTKSRIQYLWDQTTLFGNGPGGELNYGLEYDNAILSEGRAGTIDVVGHGTHIAGIAAGNGNATDYGQPANQYVGVAPGADLVVVKLTTYLEPGRISNFSNSANVIDGIKYISDKAKQLGKPWVVNLSTIPTEGPRNGTSLFELSVQAIINNPAYGKGRVVVSAAGNENQDSRDLDDKRNWNHTSGQGTTTRTLNIEGTLENKEESANFQIYYPKFENYKVTLISPSGKRYGPVEKNDAILEDTDDGGVFIFNLEDGSNPALTDAVVSFGIRDRDTNSDGIFDVQIRSGRWKVKIEGSSGSWDMYKIAAGGHPIGNFLKGDNDNNHKIREPGSLQEVICVGSIASRNQWVDLGRITQNQPSQAAIGQISYFSNRGTSRNGLSKPDTYAPGDVIVSSFSAQTLPKYFTNRLLVQDGKHVVKAGTSMSAPHVVGAMALLLQKDIQEGKNRSPGQLKNWLLNTRTDDKVLDVLQLLTANPITGINDKVEFDFVPNRMNLGEIHTFNARFIDQDDPSIPQQWEWRLYLEHEDGQYEIANTTHITNNVTNSWTVTLPTNLPDGYEWSRDENGDIISKVSAITRDQDDFGNGNTATTALGFRPNVPIVFNFRIENGKIKMNYTALGASSFKVYYDTDTDLSFTSSGADMGPSPIVDSDLPNITIDGLNTAEQAYLKVSAVNDYGETEGKVIYSVENGKVNSYMPLEGSISEDLMINPSQSFLLTRITTVKEGATLSLLPGSVLKASKNGGLVVEKGSKLLAEGTRSKPIVFTSLAAETLRKAGDWNGVLICGNAPSALLPTYKVFDITTSGGRQVMDDSGILKYVRIEHAGTSFFTNALTLAGVGRGTQINYVQISQSGYNGLGLYGGTVDMKYFVGYLNSGTDIITQYGNRSRLQFGALLGQGNLNDTNASVKHGILSWNGPEHNIHSNINTSTTFSNFDILSIDGNKGFWLIDDKTTTSLFNSTVGGWGDDQISASSSPNKVKLNGTVLGGVQTQSGLGQTGHPDLLIGNSISGFGKVDPLNFKTPKWILFSTSPLNTGADFSGARLQNFFRKVDFRGAFPKERVPFANWKNEWTKFGVDIPVQNRLGLGTKSGKSLNGALVLHPNPASKEVSINFELERDSEVTYVITDLIEGKEMYREKVGLKTAGARFKAINIQNLSPGTYQVKIITSEQVFSEKLLIE